MATFSSQSYKFFLEQLLRMEAADRRNNLIARQTPLASVRMSPHGYWTVIGFLTFAAVLCVQLQYDFAAVTTLALAWLGLPLLAYYDRVQFDGHKLVRRGLWAWLARWRGWTAELPLTDIEWVETSALRHLRSGGRTYYRYRCAVSGNGQTFTFASGGLAFRRLVRALFGQLPEAKLDARSLELRDHLVEPETLRQTLERLKLASEDLLRGIAPERRAAKLSENILRATTEEDLARGQLLRRAANELYVLGRLREAAEAFRRALRLLPQDGWLLYEFARFLHSQAGVMRDEDLFRRGQAALRLAARRSAGDAALLMRLGESFMEYGDPRWAERLFRRALASNPEVFRAATGLAELGLRRGQLAHVLHHYGGAAACAPDAALERLVAREAAYYERLNGDESYLDAELSRLSWLQTLMQARRLSSRLTVGGTLLALLGPLLSSAIGPFGWALTAAALPVWAGTLLGTRLFANRKRPGQEGE
jgi:Tfp pilus assembly protein PilF